MKKILLFLKRTLFFVVLMSVSIALFYLKETNGWYIIAADIDVLLCIVLLIIHLDTFKGRNDLWLTIPLFMSIFLWLDSAYQNILLALAIIPIAIISFIVYMFLCLRTYFREEQTSFDPAGY